MMNRRQLPVASFWVVAALAIVAMSCGPRVDRIPLNDPRLPLDARRWLADAEDEVAIADVSLDDAQRELAEARSFRRYAESLNWPSGAGPCSQRIDSMVDERLALARLEVDLANQRITLARANLVKARAETAVRHDIAAYNLSPITSASEEAREDLEELAHRVEQQRAALDQATTQFWEAYGSFARSGNNNVMWTWEDEEVIH